MSPEAPLRRTEVDRPDYRELVVELPSDLGEIETAVSYLAGRCRAVDFRGPKLDLNFRVGVTEALANAVLYGNQSNPAKTVRIEVRVNARRVEVSVSDEGVGFDPESVPDPTDPRRIEVPGGRGLFLIRKLMDELEFNERGNALRMVLHRRGPGTAP